MGPSANFRERVLGGGAWLAATQTAAQLIQFAVTAVLAHVLGPRDFGLFALCAVVLGLSVVFREVGMPEALVQAPRLTAGHKNGAFWTTAALAAALAALMAAGAGPVARLLGDVRVAPLVRLAAVDFVIASFGMVPAAILSRDLAFRRLGVCDVAGVAANAAVALPLAFRGFGARSLVWGLVAGDAARTALLFVQARWRPGWRMTRRDVVELFRFGRSVMGASAAYSVRTYIDKLLVGRFLGAATLGGYNLSFRIMTAPQQRFGWLISRLTLPAFSSIQDDDARVGRIYLKALTLIALVVTPAMAGLAVVADDFVRMVYGPAWLFIVPALRVMCAAGVFYAVGTTVGPVLVAQGRPQWLFRLSLLLTASLAAGIAVTLPFGLTAVGVGFTVAAALGYGVGFVMVARLLRLRARAFLGAFRSPAVAAAAAAFAATAVRVALAGYGPGVRLGGAVAAGVGAWAFAVWLSRVPALVEVGAFARGRWTTFVAARRSSA